MKVLTNFLTVVLGIVFLVGCGGGGSSSSNKCINPNVVLPSMQDVLTFFPQSLINEQHLFIGQIVSFAPISDIEGYKQLLENAGFKLDIFTSNSYDFMHYIGLPIDNKYSTHVYVDMKDNFISWQLGVWMTNGILSATEIDESIFDIIAIFPPTGTKKIEIEMYKEYETNITTEMNTYIQELIDAGFKYYDEDADWNAYQKPSADGCLLYSWANYNEYNRAEWRVWRLE
jgi:hypothetical protein